MALPNALHLALDLARTPLLAPTMRRQPLPDDILLLIRLAAADTATIDRLSKRTRRDGSALRAAAVLYIQQVMWSPDADHYRELGVNRDALPEKLKEHVRWLMKWLHPDRPQSAEDAVFRDRVLAAWNALKTPQRRQQYDEALKLQPPRAPQRRRRPRLPWIATGEQEPAEGSGIVWWRVFSLLAIMAAVAFWFIGGDWPLPNPMLTKDASASAPTSAKPSPGGEEHTQKQAGAVGDDR